MRIKTNTLPSCSFSVPELDAGAGRLRDSMGVVLPAQKYNLALNFFYDGSSPENAEYGQRRSASTRARIVSSTSSSRVTFIAGDLRSYGYGKKRRTAQEPGGSVSTMIWDCEDYLGEV